MAKAVSASQKDLTRVYTNDDGSVTVLTSGGRNWRNNNPGNIKYGDNARAAGAIGRDNDGFAIFPDYRSGLQGMLNVLKGKYGNSTIDQAMQKYAPPSENDTARYTTFLKKRVGAPDGTLIKDLTPDELDRLVSGIPVYEGWRAGTITGPNNSMGGPAQRPAGRADPFQRGGGTVPHLAQMQAVDPAFGATSWPPRPGSPNVLSPDGTGQFAGAPTTAPIPFLDGTTRTQHALDNSLPAPGAAPWDLSDRFGKWSGLGGVLGPASASHAAIGDQYDAPWPPAASALAPNALEEQNAVDAPAVRRSDIRRLSRRDDPNEADVFTTGAPPVPYRPRW